MSSAQIRELVETGAMVGLTLDQYIQMIDAGILPEGAPIELLDGFLVRKDRSKTGENPLTVGFEHVWAVQTLIGVLRAAAEKHGCHLSVQQPIGLPPDCAPEPDGAITRGTVDDYRHRYPSAADVPCVIEVADSSLHHDRLTKKRIYAQAGIEQYVIINLVDRVVELFAAPIQAIGTYDQEAILGPEEIVRFSTDSGAVVEVEAARLLP